MYGRVVGFLSHREIELAGEPFLERVVPDVADDADYASTIPSERDDLTDRIAPRPEHPRERLVQDDDLRCIRTVAGGEVAAAADGNPHRREVPVAHDPDERLRVLITGVHLALTGHTPTALSAKGQRIGQRGVLDARNRQNTSS